MAFKDYSTTPGSNTELADGTYIGPNMLRNKVRPAIQQLAADGRDVYDELTGLIDSIPKGDPGVDGTNGVNGGAGSGSGFAALFGAANGMTIAAGDKRIKMDGHSLPGIGGADYIYDAAVNSTTVAANPRTQFLAADGRGFKLDPNQRLTDEMFGDTSTAAAASATLRAAADFRAYSASIKYGAPVVIDQAGTTLSETLEPNGVFRFEGVSSLSRNPGSAGQLPSLITGPVDQVTIRFRSSGTEGLALSPGKNSSAGSLLEGVTITQPTGTDYQAHGIHIRSTVTLKNVVLTNIAGDGINISAKSSGGDGATLGNANLWHLQQVSVHTARGNGLCVGRLNGVSTSADVNAGLALHLHIHTAGRCGILDRAVYQNTYIAPLVNAAGNGGVWHLGFEWQLQTDQDTGTEPGTNINIWYKVRALAAPSTNFPQWLVGETYYSELYINAAQAVIITPYAENQHAYSHNPNGIVIGGNMSWTQSTPWLRPEPGIGIVTNMGIGHYRGTAGEGANHPAFAHIGLTEQTLLGMPLAGVEDIHKRAHIFYHQCDTNYLVTKYENNDGGGVPRDIFTRAGTSTAANELWAISGKGTAKTFGRSAPLEDHFILFDHGIQDPANANNIRVHGMRSAAPTGDRARGELYYNISPSAAGGIVAWVCTVGHATTPTMTPLRLYDQMPAQADSAAAPTQAEFNALLAKLRAAGLMLP